MKFRVSFTNNEVPVTCVYSFTVSATTEILANTKAEKMCRELFPNWSKTCTWRKLSTTEIKKGK